MSRHQAAAMLVGQRRQALDPSFVSPYHTLSNGNLTFTHDNVAVNQGWLRALYPFGPGKFYWELLLTHMFNPDYLRAGIGDPASPTSGANYQYMSNNGTSTPGPGSISGGFANGDTMCFAYDKPNARIWYRKNGGLWQGSGTADPVANVGGDAVTVTGNIRAVVEDQGFVDVGTFNFGDSPFAFTKPTGYSNA